MIEKPIILIGSGRSGTSLLASILEQHPDVAYWGEPRPIWMHGNAYRKDQALRAENLTPRIGRFIDRKFTQFLAESGRKRFMEKTPSNCLRIEFIYALYPDCKIVNIIRDGRDVVRSMLQMQTRNPNPGLLGTRFRETPLFDWPAYLPMFFHTVWRIRVLGKPALHLGAKPPGWKDWLDLPPHVAVAKQWNALVSASIRDGRPLPASNYLEIRYEDLVRASESVVKGVLQFCELPECRETIDFALASIEPGMEHRWKSTLTSDQERELVECMQPLLEELGYV